jgi:serralysin
VTDIADIIQHLHTHWGGDDEGETKSWFKTDVKYSLYTSSNPTLDLLGYQTLTTRQQSFAREAYELWDDLIAISLTETTSLLDSDIATAYRTGTEHSYTSVGTDGELGDVKVVLEASELELQDGMLAYGIGFDTYLHEIGHSLGLSHPGPYDSLDDEPDLYADDAVYAEDTEQYTVMSYFDAGLDGSGADHQIYEASTPLLHDIAAIQAKYGADMTTRTGDTVYGFNSNAGRGAFDFTQNTHPIIAIWDAGGNDTLDTSGFLDNQQIDLHAGSFSNVGGLTLNVAIAYNVTIENAIGGSATDIITGNQAANRLEGRAGSDVLDGREGADIMIGGEGDDGYTVETPDTYDWPGEIIFFGPDIDLAAIIPGDQVIEAANEGHDTVASWISYTLPDNVEELRLLGSADLNGRGNGLDNLLYGNAGINRLEGLAGNDMLNGREGADIMLGGAGDDSYFVDTPDIFDWPDEIIFFGPDIEVTPTIPGDRVIEHANQGVDMVTATIDYTLPENVEKLILGGFSSLDGEGNGLDNELIGNGSVNRLAGFAGDDRLDGGAHADIMLGGSGDDTYVVDNAGDQVIELSGEGVDLVESSVSFFLPDNVEHLTLTGPANINATGNGFANTITGNTGANILDGGAGADMLIGGGGNDTYLVDTIGDQIVEAGGEGADLVRSSVSYTLGANIENLTLIGTANIGGTGNGLKNTITGNSGANVLDGGAGADIMTGGAGDDTYVVDTVHSLPILSDRVIETSGQGTDLVRSSVSYTLGANVENLTLTGAGNISGTGNALANIITGNGGANVLHGGNGDDTVSGGGGNDTLSGGAGADRLSGGLGHDNFLFNTALSGSKLGPESIDRITDFSVLDDTIQLEDAVFTELTGPGPLSAEAFFIGTAAQDADDRIIYNSSTGNLIYDADGNGAGSAVMFATLGLGLALSHNDFFIV